MEGGGSVNVTCPTTGRCEKLPPHCLDCDFDYNCTYGDLTEASCAPLESVECKVLLGGMRGRCSCPEISKYADKSKIAMLNYDTFAGLVSPLSRCEFL